jgi:hypothetical protein
MLFGNYNQTQPSSLYMWIAEFWDANIVQKSKNMFDFDDFFHRTTFWVNALSWEFSLQVPNE